MSLKNISQFPDGNSYAHYHPQLDRLVVTNSNGVLKIINVNDPESLPVSIDCLSNVTSVSIHGDKLALTTTEGKLEIVDLATHESLGEKYRTALSLRDLAYINSGNRILCGGDDSKLVVIDLQGDEAATKTIALQDQLLDIAYDHAGELSSVSLSNGSVEIYSVFNEELNLNHTLQNVITRKIHTSMDEVDYAQEHRDELYTTKTEWTKDGRYLLVPGADNAVHVYNRENWNKVRSFPSDGRIVDFKLHGNNLAILTLNVYKVYNFETGKTVHEDDFEFRYEGLPLNIEWHDKTGLFIGSTHGDVLMLKNVISVGGEEGGGGGGGGKSKARAAASLFVDEFDEDEEEEGEGADKVEGDEEGEDLTGDNQREMDDLFERAGPRENGKGKRLYEYLSEEELDLDDFDNSILDDVGGHAQGKNGHSNGLHKKHKASNEARTYSKNTGVTSTRIHPYSPGSTSFANRGDAVDRRYLTMNNIGYAWIVINREPGACNSITVSFFDRSSNSEYHFTAHEKFDLASMNNRCILLGDSTKGLIHYKSHNNAGSSEAWERQVPLVTDEYITSICITNLPSFNTIVVGTNIGYLRFFNQYGVCLNIIKTQPVVALAPASTTSNIFMINQVAANVYSYSIIDINQDNKFIQQNCSIPLKERANRQLIKGIFFSEHNDPCVVGGYDDTVFILSSWREAGNARWVPLLNCHNSITEYGSNENKKNWSCWPLGLVNDSLNCLLLKNGQYPGFPLPLPIEIEMEIPTKVKHEEDGAEEEFVRSVTMGKLLSDSLTHREEEKDDDDGDGDADEDEEAMMERLNQYSMSFDKSLLKMFGESCKESKLNKAFAIAKLIKTDKALIAAAKISERMEYMSLASKIGQLREQLQIEIDSD